MEASIEGLSFGVPMLENQRVKELGHEMGVSYTVSF